MEPGRGRSRGRRGRGRHKTQPKPASTYVTKPIRTEDSTVPICLRSNLLGVFILCFCHCLCYLLIDGAACDCVCIKLQAAALPPHTASSTRRYSCLPLKRTGWSCSCFTLQASRGTSKVTKANRPSLPVSTLTLCKRPNFVSMYLDTASSLKWAVGKRREGEGAYEHLVCTQITAHKHSTERRVAQAHI